MSAYTVEIVTTGNASPPDKQPHRGMSCASSAVWCRVTRGDESTGWVECRKGAMFEAVTGVPWPL